MQGGEDLVRRQHVKGDALSEAIYSPCMLYRYELTRVWDGAGTRALFYPYADELRSRPPDLELLQALAQHTGGKVGASRLPR